MAKCGINPSTRSEHLYYLHPRLACYTPKPKEELQPRGNHIPGPRGLNVPAHPKGRPTRRPTAQAKAAISSSKGPGSPSPQPSVDGPSIDSKQHVGLRDQPTRRTIHRARSSQRYAHSTRIYEPQCRAMPGAFVPPADSTAVPFGDSHPHSGGSE